MALQKRRPSGAACGRFRPRRHFPTDGSGRRMEKVMAQGDSAVTDDAMMLETAFGEQVRVIEGSYQNLKITTPEDIMAAELYLNRKERKKC